MRTLHEVVVRNRLEQLRKRQRDEALHAQEELLAGVAQHATTGAIQQTSAPAIVATAEEVAEPYERGMSPALIDITKLPMDEREIDIITVEEDLRALVSFDIHIRFFDSNTNVCIVSASPCRR